MANFVISKNFGACGASGKVANIIFLYKIIRETLTNPKGTHTAPESRCHTTLDTLGDTLTVSLEFGR